MAISCRSEIKLLSHEELQTVSATHHPAIYECDLKELRTVQARLRAERAKLRTLINRSRRIHKGKPDPRENNPPANAEHLKRRKQVFAKALKRVNNEIKRLRKIHANTMLAEAAHRALASRRANFVAPPNAGRTASAACSPTRAHAGGRPYRAIRSAVFPRRRRWPRPFAMPEAPPPKQTEQRRYLSKIGVAPKALVRLPIAARA